LYETEENPAITRALLAKKRGKAVRTIQRSINALKENRIISRNGPNKKGFWVINKEK
jgi:predicted HTH transcriptional regulator